MKETLDKNFHGFEIVHVVDNRPVEERYKNYIQVFIAYSPETPPVAEFYESSNANPYTLAKAWVKNLSEPETRTALTLKQSMVLEMVKADLTNKDVDYEDVLSYCTLADAILAIK